ncbi:MAG: hypothetical protein C0519_00950 [Hyphomicrobium sp.]|nr:hypothetical protein [Hyphomicrobium sp.]
MARDFIDSLEKEVAALEAELEQSAPFRRLLRARELLAEYRSERVSEERGPRSDQAPEVAKSSAVRRQRKETTQAILDAVAEILSDSSSPVRTANILTMLREKGFEIPGGKALNNLSAIISYSKMFESHGRLGWTLIRDPSTNLNAEAADSPGPSRQTSTASVDGRLTSGASGVPVEPVQGGGA